MPRFEEHRPTANEKLTGMPTSRLTMLDVIVRWHILSGPRFTCLNRPVVSGIQPAHATSPSLRQGIALHIPIIERAKSHKSCRFRSELPASSTPSASTLLPYPTSTLAVSGLFFGLGLGEQNL